jgi:hypothetical protein
MKLPSVNYLLSNAKKSLLRFPLTIGSSLIAVVFGIYLVEKGRDLSNMFPYINIVLCASIGIPLYFSVTIFSCSAGFAILRNNSDLRDFYFNVENYIIVLGNYWK